MTKKTSQWKTMALLAGCIFVSMCSKASAASYPLYQLHTTGSIWGYTGTPCNGNGCNGWVQLDDNPSTSQIVAGGGSLYQMHTNGVVWKWTGVTCNGNSCPGWVEIDNNPSNPAAQIVGAAGSLYERRVDGSLWHFTGQVCNGGNCPGWQEFDNYSGITGVYDNAGGLVEGRLTFTPAPVYSFWAYNGKPCAGNSCPGWYQIDITGSDLEEAAVSYTSIYELLGTGETRQYTGVPCGATCTGWLPIGNNLHNSVITAAANLYQLRTTHTVWQYDGTPCNGTNCNGWLELDSNPAISYILAGGNTVYEQHTDGSIWQYTGPTCSPNGGCPGWVKLDGNSLTRLIVPN